MIAEQSASDSTPLRLLHDAKTYLQLVLDERVPNSMIALAWSDFYHVYDRMIRRYVVAQGLTSADVDDCVQEVWSEVVVRLAKFDRRPDRPGLRAWLYKLVRSKTADAYRARQRRPSAGLDKVVDLAAEPVDETDILSDLQWQAALVESVLTELQTKMSSTSYRVLRMRLCDGCDVADVARELNLKPAQVRYRYHRAKQKLRTHLAFLTGRPVGAKS